MALEDEARHFLARQMAEEQEKRRREDERRQINEADAAYRAREVELRTRESVELVALIRGAGRPDRWLGDVAHRSGNEIMASDVRGWVLSAPYTVPMRGDHPIGARRSVSGWALTVDAGWCRLAPAGFTPPAQEAASPPDHEEIVAFAAGVVDGRLPLEPELDVWSPRKGKVPSLWWWRLKLWWSGLSPATAGVGGRPHIVWRRH